MALRVKPQAIGYDIFSTYFRFQVFRLLRTAGKITAVLIEK
ncbi:hypothetical protein D1AOALGA4SA_7459 [Olavius algarvensis Delta 1 endosymbiont]|nr:hypothetical protein D1AOALGA4SA_7459 [Olavius algarvensis Delta 1 endosymbiont]